jgi:phosphoserine phosphatase RsbU/P
MKRFWRIVRHRFRAFERSVQRLRENLSAARLLLIFEAMLISFTLIILLTGSRAVAIDRLGGRTDIWLLIFSVALLAFLHFFVNMRIAPALDRRFAAPRYDDRRILFDLGQAARGVASIDELYKLVVEKIGEALRVGDVSIFVRDDATGDYVCRICSCADDNEEEKGGSDGDDSNSLTLSPDAFVVKRLRNLAIPLGIEPQDFVTWSRALAGASPATRLAREREQRLLKRIKARMLQQVMIKDQLVGIIALGTRAGNRPFTHEDKQLLIQIAGQMAFVIENSKLVEHMAEEERMRRELALASEVQARLFPARAPVLEGLELSGFCQPAREVGGDYYDFLLLDNEQIGVAIADVSGKGISAAILMSIVQASLRSQAMALNPGLGTEGSLADLVRTMNRLVWRSTSESSYVTFFYAQFDERTRRLIYTNAGHNPPLLLRATNGEPESDPESGVFGSQHGGRNNHMRSLKRGDTKTSEHPAITLLDDASEEETVKRHVCLKLSTGGPVLGVFDDCYYEQETVEMCAGDVLVAYTDGVTEALNAAGEEFGEKRLQSALIETAHSSADKIRAHLVERLRAWAMGAAAHDDLTFIVMKVK